ncbi:hypothetical protein [Kitasatospora sp. NPDC059571]|uniref:hypothetical protein n=1 Tax=Kitasatospora sp. NPDC059571 TaxID=3346871 RepID=UPI0036AEE7A2
MRSFEWVVLALLWVVVLLPAVPALTRGTLPPWWRGPARNPRLWGVGDLVLGLGATASMTARHWSSSGWALGGAVGLCGIGLMTWAGRPRPS